MLSNTDEYKNLMRLLDSIEEKYGFNMHTQCKVNYEFLTVWREMCDIYVDDVYLTAAVKFILACCIADKILDSKRFVQDEKESVSGMLMHIRENNYQIAQTERFNELGILFNEIFHVIYSIWDEDLKQMLINKIERAFRSEDFMWRYKLTDVSERDIDFSLLVDKSIEFESAALLLSISQEYNNKYVSCANLIGKIFAMVDDMCDFIEDIKNNRINSILYWNRFNCDNTLENRIDSVVDNMESFIAKLDSAITELKAHVSDDAYYYIMGMIKEWCLIIPQ